MACPPKPASHNGRCGWSHNPRTSSKVSPPSVDLNSADGCVPAQTTPGSVGDATICQTRSTVAGLSPSVVPTGNAIGPCSEPTGSCQVAPRSSE